MLTQSSHSLRLAGLAMLALMFFHELILAPGEVLYSPRSDMLSMHVPKKQFLVRHWRQDGELPLWLPYEFAGSPFIHDLQVAAFYPPHGLLYLTGEEHVALVLSWLVVAHIVLAGWFAYGYAREEGLGPDAAFITGVGTMFAGKWLLHMLAAGHYILVGLAWLPLVLWMMNRAIRRTSIASATLAGIAFAMLILGTHPQWTFYAGLLVGLWTLPAALSRAGVFEPRRDVTPLSLPKAMGLWIGAGAWTAIVGAVLSAIQLLPTLEATQYANRAAVGVSEGVGLKAVLGTWVMMIGPGLNHAGHGTMGWELRGNLAFLWILCAVLAVVLGRGREWYYAAVAFLLMAFSAGLGEIVQTWPGFRLFRLPSRAATLLALPLGFLAGAASQRIFDGALRDAAIAKRARVTALVAVLVVGLLGWLDVIIGNAIMHELDRSARPPLNPYWWAAFVSVPAFVVLLWMAASGLSRTLRCVWIGLLAFDVMFLSWPEVEVLDAAKVYTPADTVTFLKTNLSLGERILDRDAMHEEGDRISPLGPIQPIVQEISTLRGYNPLSVQRYREYVNFIANENRPPRAEDIGVTTFPIVNRNLLDMVGVRYLVQPATELSQVKDNAVEESKGWKKVHSDPTPVVYVFSMFGITPVEPYETWENLAVYPRAFVVSAEATATPPRNEVMEALAAADFRRTVFIEYPEHGSVPQPGNAKPPPLPASPLAAEETGGEAFRAAEIKEYLPNRVTIEVEGNTPGWLVLTDVWFPGWKCSVDGRDAPVYRGNYAFRAVQVPAGRHSVVFRFEPQSLRLGTQITLYGGGACFALALLGAWATRWSRRAVRSAE